MRIWISWCIALTLCHSTFAAETKKDDEKPKWDVSAAHGKTKTAKFSVSEGTWMNVDVSPDGKQIVFDLVGDLYSMPITGGKATRISGGKAFEVQPRFSPDGKRISFTSDRAGGDNIWTSKLDGSDAKQITKESFRLMNNASWTPDGEYLVARKHFTSGRSLGAGEMWLYHHGGGEGLQLTKKKNDQQDSGQPTLSPDGRYVYYSEDNTAGQFFQYNKNVHDSIYSIRRLDRETGENMNLVRVQGGSVSPTPSPDGKTLAFVRRVRDKTVLHTFDLASGAITPIWDGLSQDQQEVWAIFGAYTNFAWTPDSQQIVIWGKGKIWKVDVAAKTASEIAFTADVEQLLDEPVRASFRLEGDTFQPHMIRDVATSPDRKNIIFHAAGKLYQKALANGNPQRLTQAADVFEYSPSFSPDGAKIVYVTWSDADLQKIVLRTVADGSERVISDKPGFYGTPQFSPDGSAVVYVKQSGGGLTDYRYAMDQGIYLLDLASGKSKRISKQGREPVFIDGGKRVAYLQSTGELEKTFSSVDLHGADLREHFKLKYANRIVPSPDGRWVAFTELFNAYLAPLPLTGGAIELSKDTKAIPVTQISHDVGSYLHWSADSRALNWMVGRDYFSRDLKDTFAFVDGAPKTLPKPDALKGVNVGLSLASDMPSGKIALKGARIISMKGDEVIENGTVLVEKNRIIAVGADVTIPADAKVIDVTGKTIIPGMVDVHAHASHFHNGPNPQANWAYYANLAYGITTMHDPSANTQEVFTQAEMQKSGVIVGPRIFSTGSILYGADGDFKVVINSLDDARSHLRRMKAHGAMSVKSYNQPRREQRQQVNQAARELGMIVVMEGGSTFYHNMTMVLDGSTGIEHNLPIAPLYDDVINTWKATDVRYTPTLVVNYGGLNGEYWWYQHQNIWENEKLLKFFPRETLDARSIRREAAPDWDFYHIEVAKAAKKARDAGIKVMVGGHGQLQGLAPHWETWMLVQGGFTPMEALRAATIDGADYLGLSADLGSLEKGKMADLVVLNHDPREDIQHTADNAMVMVNGRLFDGDSMAEIGNHTRPAPVFYWQRHGGANGMSNNNLFGPTAECHCPKGAH